MHKKMPKDIDAMLKAVHAAFYELEPRTLSDVWMSLQYVMNEILKCKGSNDYDLPHVNKRKLLRQGNLPSVVKAPTWAVIEAWNIVNAIPTQTEPQMETETTEYETQDHEDVM